MSETNKIILRRTEGILYSFSKSYSFSPKFSTKKAHFLIYAHFSTDY